MGLELRPAKALAPDRMITPESIRFKGSTQAAGIINGHYDCDGKQPSGLGHARTWDISATVMRVDLAVSPCAE